LGEVFNKVYVAERFIADGTFGRVLLVRHRFTNVQYAMKIIKSDKKNIKNAQLEVEILEIL
jgi:serine/threonine protein kinase